MLITFWKISITPFENYFQKEKVVPMINKTEHAVQSYAAGNEVLSLLKYELLIKGKQQC